VTPLTQLRVLVLDAQATAASPARGALLEIGWARWSAGESRELPAAEVNARVVAPPPGASVPPAVARVTGIRAGEWARGEPAPTLWRDLCRAAGELSTTPAPAVAHFVRFEEPFLRALHAAHGTGPFPLDLVCTHAIASRLLPELPRRTLRALAGYFGAGVPSLRRSADHVAATAFVWRHLVAALAEREGVLDLAALREWLARPVRRSPRRFPLPRERRLELPDRPGVYRLLRAGGAVVYVGKAASLRQRVGSHFHAGGSERSLEMLTQVRDLDCTETATALEAALLEADEIKRLAPAFNVALAREGRAVWFARPDLASVREGPDAEHSVGPLVSPVPVEGLRALRAILASGRAPTAAERARAVGVEPPWAPGPTCFAAGIARFAVEHGSPRKARDLMRLGARLWSRRGGERESGAETANERDADTPRRPDWDEERVRHALEETVLRAAHAARRGRWLLRLSESSLAWVEPATPSRRLLVIGGGAVIRRADLPPGASLPAPPGHRRTPAERRAAFDVATFDRLRVLTTELRRLAVDAPSIELRLGRHARLSRRRLETVLRWV
jgi:DNA polymerase-3 subunit epsilon